ncbi:MAG: molybdopterin-guanine dinucleotide biosynthesis protein B [Burkholderiales bacterium]|nr:molybdopterin-guanine dinucleotide biosynthesis protein B [Burkholderiales bacterium]
MTHRVFGFAGWSGSGKTTLIEQVIAELVRRRVRVSLIKHAHHGFDVDQPGKDSFRHRQAGASEVLVTSGKRWALMHELRDEAEPGLQESLARFAPCDLIVVEGFKRESIAKLEVWRAAIGKPLLFPTDPNVIALASDDPLPAGLGEPGNTRFGLSDINAIATFALERATAVR